MNYYRHYCGDYLRDTTALSLAEHGAYTLLLDAYYSDEKPLPAELSKLYRICRAADDQERAAVREVAERFFPLNGDGSRHNKRADEEIRKAQQAIDQMRNAGRAGARRRWDKNMGQGIADPMGNPIGHPTENDGAPYRVEDRGGDRGGDTSSNHQPPTPNPHTPTPNPQPPTKARSKATPRAAPASLPDWLPLDAWGAYCEMRAKIRAPMTERAKTLAITTLSRIMASGDDPKAVLERSIERSWRGLFPLADQRQNRNKSAAQAWLERKP